MCAVRQRQGDGNIQRKRLESRAQGGERTGMQGAKQTEKKVKIVFVVAANRTDRSERQEANGKEQYRGAFPNRLNDKMTSTCRGQTYETRTSM